MASAERWLPSPELIDRTLRIENSYTVSRMKVLESIPGNPVGIQFRPISCSCGRQARGDRDSLCRGRSRLPGRCVVRSDLSPARSACRAAAAPDSRKRRCRRRVHLQQRSVSICEPSQHGARRDADAIQPFDLDQAGAIKAVLISPRKSGAREKRSVASRPLQIHAQLKVMKTEIILPDPLMQLGR